MTYKSIANYGINGDMHTAALVGQNRSVDWLCRSDFDSPSIFASIPDDNKVGFFSITSVSSPEQCRDEHRQVELTVANGKSVGGVQVNAMAPYLQALNAPFLDVLSSCCLGLSQHSTGSRTMGSTSSTAYLWIDQTLPHQI